MNSDAVWSILLLLIAVVIIAIEFVIPSGGLLGICAVCATIASVVIAFKAGTTWGMSMLAAAFFAVPSTIFGMLKILPHTAIGRRMFGQPKAFRDVQGDAMTKWVGEVGVALTELMPGGVIEIHGQRMEGMAPGVVISQGQHIEVTRVSGSTLYVIPTDRPLTKSITATETPGDLLDKPLSEFGLDDLAPPSLLKRGVDAVAGLVAFWV